MAESIRPALPQDLPSILNLIRELARFERAESEFVLQESELQQALFGSTPLCFAWVAQVQEHCAGFLLGYYRFSTWKGRMLYVEDIYVQESFRGQGLGQKLMQAAIHKAQEENLAGLTWQVLDWNQPAIDWYAKMGAKLDAEWINVRLLPPAIFEA
jgi:ribosomal protein S18 acetylase RimI-like enzyme